MRRAFPRPGRAGFLNTFFAAAVGYSSSSTSGVESSFGSENSTLRDRLIDRFSHSFTTTCLHVCGEGRGTGTEVGGEKPNPIQFDFRSRSLRSVPQQSHPSRHARLRCTHRVEHLELGLEGGKEWRGEQRGQGQQHASDGTRHTQREVSHANRSPTRCKPRAHSACVCAGHKRTLASSVQ